MLAFLVLTLVITVRASDTTNDTAVEEKLVIARGKLLVSMDNFKISPCHDHNVLQMKWKEDWGHSDSVQRVGK